MLRTATSTGSTSGESRVSQVERHRLDIRSHGSDLDDIKVAPVVQLRAT